MKKLILTILSLMLVLPILASADVFINEVELNDGSSTQWVELYNNGTESESLDGWTLNKQSGLPPNFHDFGAEDSIASEGYFIASGTWGLDDSGTIRVILKNGSTVEDEAFDDDDFVNDTDDDSYTWQRDTDGYDTNDKSDFKWRDETKDATNNYIECNESERDDDTNWTACIAGEQSRTTYSCNTQTGDWDPTNHTYDECNWGTCSGDDSQDRSYYTGNDTELTNETNACIWSECGTGYGGSTVKYKERYLYYTTDVADGSDVENYAWEWCAYSETGAYWETSFTVYPGWNLFSTPYYLLDDAVEAVFGEHNATNNYTVYGYYPDREGEDKWKTFPYTNESDPSALLTIEPPHAYWVKINEPYQGKNIVLEGKFGDIMELPSEFNLSAGWNLFGIYNLNYDRWHTATALGNPLIYTLSNCDYEEVSDYRSDDEYYKFDCTMVRDAGENPLMYIAYDDLFVPTYGSWIYLEEDTIYQPNFRGGGGSLTGQGLGGYVAEFPVFDHYTA
jgi:hypothetical protein